MLPGFANHPIGGYKIIFEYANRLSKDGFDVQIVFLNNDRWKKIGMDATDTIIFSNSI